jgi:hypothetical protein
MRFHGRPVERWIRQEKVEVVIRPGATLSPGKNIVDAHICHARNDASATTHNYFPQDITSLTVEVELPDSNITEQYYIIGTDIAEERKIDLTNVWGHVNLYAHGAGQAVAQLDLTYGVDYEPHKVGGIEV